jgi:hypothetical protein
MRLSRFLAVPLILMASALARAQNSIDAGGGVVGGVAITTGGFLQYRQVAAPATAAGAAASSQAEQLYVSLPRVLAEWKAARDSGREPPADVRYLKGLARIENVFIYPGEHDIVLAGSSETYRADNPLEPLGIATGRPVVQLEDLIVAMRAVAAGARGQGRTGVPGGRDFFGCSLENPANFQEAWNATFTKYGKGPRNVLLAEMKKALGPQEVKLYGVPEDSRVAFTMLAADYRLKRLAMGVETVPAIGNALGTETAAPRIWFEPAYEPLLMAEDGNSYELRGPRLKVLVGAQQFNPGGATEAQRRFGENFSKNMPAVAQRIDAIADLQNVVDCFMVAALIRQDRLAEKAGLDWAWLTSAEGIAQYKTASLPVPRTADTVVHISGNVLAQGGVALAYANFTGVGRSTDKPVFQAAPARPADAWYLLKQR